MSNKCQNCEEYFISDIKQTYCDNKIREKIPSFRELWKIHKVSHEMLYFSNKLNLLEKDFPYDLDFAHGKVYFVGNPGDSFFIIRSVQDSSKAWDANLYLKNLKYRKALWYWFYPESYEDDLQTHYGWSERTKIVHGKQISQQYYLYSINNEYLDDYNFLNIVQLFSDQLGQYILLFSMVYLLFVYTLIFIGFLFSIKKN